MTTALMTKMPPKITSKISALEQAKPVRYVPLQEFLKKYNDREDGLKYEYKDGIIIKTPAMRQETMPIRRKLTRLFNQTKAYQAGGHLEMETQVYTTPTQIRKPDLAYFTNDQVTATDNGLENQIPPFVVEIISKNDVLNDVSDKILEYFAAGVQVYWQIQPKQKIVYVYTAVDEVAICKDDKICRAEPVLSDFQITAKDLF